MIKVRLTTNNPDINYELATRFYVEQNGNLTVKADTEVIAIHANGTWASVSVDNTNNYKSKLTPEMVSGSWPNVLDDSLIYDCRGAGYIAGVTNFNVGNVSDALSACGLPQRRENLTLLVDPSLYNRLYDQHELDQTRDSIKWHLFTIEVSPVDQNLSKGSLDTLIRHTNGKTIKLITREF
jgi:hypothetical protein